jgi:hypothetical protein
MKRDWFKELFFPRGMVFGSDGLLYVSTFGCPISSDPRLDTLSGYVLRFDPRTGAFVDVFASSKPFVCLDRREAVVMDLHRPEDLVFDRRGDLWVTGFRADLAHSDKILKLNGRTGALIDQIVLGPPESTGALRLYAETLIFGPHGDLFLPVARVLNPSTIPATTTGEVWRCVSAVEAVQDHREAKRAVAYTVLFDLQGNEPGDARLRRGLVGRAVAATLSSILCFSLAVGNAIVSDPIGARAYLSVTGTRAFRLELFGCVFAVLLCAGT